MTAVNGDSLGREIVSIMLAGLGLMFLAASPAVSTATWSRLSSSIEWAARLRQGA